MDDVLDFLIVGAGPAGLSAAVEAKRGGIEKMLILEKGPSHSQMIRTFYKEGKRVDARYAGQEALCFGLLCLKDGHRESFLSFMDFVIQDNNLPIRYGTEVWSIKKNKQDLFEVHTSNNETLLARVVIIAIGKMGKPKQPDYWKDIPNTLKNNKSILFEINSRSLENLSVLVVGGGDSACEYVQLLAPKSQVTLSYRGLELSRANEINRTITLKLIQESKARSLFGSHIEKIEEENERPKVIFSKPVTLSESFDVVIYALGGMTPLDFLKNSNVEITGSGEAVVSDIKETSVRGLFIVGDLLGKAKGGGSIISGFNSASAAVRAALQRDFSKTLEAEIVSLDHMNF